MRKRTKRLIWIAVLGALAVGAWEGLWYARYVHLAVGYATKVAGSGVFVGGRELSDLAAHELERFPFVEIEVDAERGLVTGRAFGFFERHARYRRGLGVTLVDDPEQALVPTMLGFVDDPSFDPDALWPRGESVETSRGGPELRAAIDRAFEEPDPGRLRRTRAIVIVHDGRIVAERYADGYGPAVPMAGWSMTKSIINALIGVLVREGRIDIEQPAPLAQWRNADDGRSRITTRQLLHMQSGLSFVEEYDTPDSDALRMLFDSADMAAYAASRPLLSPPDEHCRYQSGTSVILARVVREVVGDADAMSFPHTALFGPVGMRSALLEPDAAGTYVGSSFSFATARDWARFGLLYLSDGVWNDERILPEGWVEFSRMPASRSRGDRWGAHWVTNQGGAMPSVPKDVFYASGYEDQYVVVVPSRRCVLVRLGQSTVDNAFRLEQFVREVLEALPQ